MGVAGGEPRPRQLTMAKSRSRRWPAERPPPNADAGIVPAPGSVRTGPRQAARLPADAVVVVTDGTANRGCPLRCLPVTCSRNVVIRNEFPYLAVIAGVFVLSYLPLGVSGDSGTWGVDRMGKDKWAGLPGRLA